MDRPGLPAHWDTLSGSDSEGTTSVFFWLARVWLLFTVPDSEGGVEVAVVEAAIESASKLMCVQRVPL